MVAIEGHVESLAELGQHTNRLQASHGHEDAEEEEDRTHIDTGEQARHTLLQALAVLGAMEIAVEDLRHRPQRAEHQEDADKRRKMGDALEDGNEEQTADTDPEHDLALSLREVALVLLAALLFAAFAVKAPVIEKSMEFDNAADSGRKSYEERKAETEARKEEERKAEKEAELPEIKSFKD